MNRIGMPSEIKIATFLHGPWLRALCVLSKIYLSRTWLDKIRIIIIFNKRQMRIISLSQRWAIVFGTTLSRMFGEILFGISPIGFTTKSQYQIDSVKLNHIDWNLDSWLLLLFVRKEPLGVYLVSTVSISRLHFDRFGHHRQSPLFAISMDASMAYDSLPIRNVSTTIEIVKYKETRQKKKKKKAYATAMQFEH